MRNSSKTIRYFSRAIYGILITFFLFLFVARFACENLNCFFRHEKCVATCVECKNCEDSNCEACKYCNKCQPDWSARSGFDDGGVLIMGILLALTILFIKNPSIIDLYNSISKINLLGTVEIDLTDLSKKIEEIESERFQEIDFDLQEELSQLNEKIIKDSSDPNEALTLIELEIEKALSNIYRVTFPEKEKISSSKKILTSSLANKRLIDVDIKEVIDRFFDIKEKDIITKRGRNIRGLIEIGRRILRILKIIMKRAYYRFREFYGKPKQINFIRSRLRKPVNNRIVLATSFSIKDSNGIFHPLENLEKNNVSIIETYLGKERNANVVKIEPIEDSKSTKLYIVIALDCSESMMNNDKFEKSKEAIILLINSLRQHKDLECGIGLYMINYNLGFVEGKLFNNDEFDELIKHILTLTPEGNTPLWQGLSNIIKNFKENIPKENQFLICLSDGRNESDDGYTFKLVEKQLVDSEISFIFIGYGNEDYSEMIHLAEISNSGGLDVGYFVGVDPEEIRYIFEDITRTITKSYRIYWETGFPEAESKVQARIVINYNTDDGKISNYEDLSYKINP